MNKEWFLAELADDIVVSLDAATVGKHSSLDYLPGSVFLGAVAKNLGSFVPERLLSGKVRFGQAYFLPAEADNCYIPLPFNYLWKKNKSKEAAININSQPADTSKSQFKSYKNVWINSKKSDSITENISKVKLSYRMKTAIDRSNGGRPVDNKLFGYQAISAGSKFLFSISGEDEETIKAVAAPLLSGIRVGRSKSSEYGRINISTAKTSLDLMPNNSGQNLIYIYMLSDAEFLNEEGMPSLCPKLSDIGLDKKFWEPDYAKTVVMSRSYSPWNGFHNCRVSDRFIVKRGSIFAYKKKQANITPKELEVISAAVKQGIGCHLEEGYGEAILNPWFLIDKVGLEVGGMELKEIEPQTQRKGSGSLDVKNELLWEFLKTKSSNQAKLIANDKASSELVELLRSSPASSSQWKKLAENVSAGKDEKEIKAYCEGGLTRKKVFGGSILDTITGNLSEERRPALIIALSKLYHQK